MALQITNTVINKDGQVIDNGTIYDVHFVIANNVVTSIQCAISAESNGDLVSIGYLRKENGRLNADFQENIEALDFLMSFSTIVKEIEAELINPEVKKK